MHIGMVTGQGIKLCCKELRGKMNSEDYNERNALLKAITILQFATLIAVV